MLGATALRQQVRAGGCIGSILNAKSYYYPIDRRHSAEGLPEDTPIPSEAAGRIRLNGDTSCQGLLGRDFVSCRRDGSDRSSAWD